MTTYYIDPTYGAGGDGLSEATPFDSWSDVTWTAGNTYLQKAGTTFSGAVTIGASGTSGNPITVGKYGEGELPIVTNSAGVGWTHGGRDYIDYSDISFSYCSSHGMGFRGANCTMDNVHFIGNGGNGCQWNPTSAQNNNTFTRLNVLNNAGHGFGNANATPGVTHTNNTFEDCVFAGCGGTDKAGLYLEFLTAATGSKLSGFVVMNCTAYGNSGSGINIANSIIAVATETTTELNVDIQISNCESYNNGNAGIRLLRASGNSFVRDCTIYGNGAAGTLGGIWCGGNKDLVVVNNEVYNNTTNGIDGAGIFDDQFNDRCVFAGNYVHDNLGRSDLNEWNGFGIACYNARNSLHYGNVVVGNRYNAQFGHNDLSNITCVNNIYADSTDRNIAIWQSGGDVRFYNNIVYGGTYSFYTGDSFTAYYSDVYGGTLGYRANTNTTLDASCITADPLLSSDYKPSANSPCIGAGTYVLPGATDHRGLAFRHDGPTIGAFEMRPKVMLVG